MMESIVRPLGDLEIVYKITQAVHSEIDLDKIFKIALDMTIALEYVDMSFIYLIDFDANEAVLRAHRNVPNDYIKRAGRIPYPKGITWKIIHSGITLNVKNIQEDPFVGPAGRDLGHHGVLGVPITLDNKVVGVIYFASYVKHQFGRRALNLLSTIGNQIGISVAKAELYRNLSKKNRHQAIIGSVTKAIHQSIDLIQVLENTTESMVQNIETIDAIVIYLLKENKLVLKSQRGMSDQYIKQASEILHSNRAVWKTFDENIPIYCEDVESDKLLSEAGKEMGIQSYFCMPLRVKGQNVGVLKASSFSKHAFEKEDLQLLNIVKKQIEVAIRNAKQAATLGELARHLESVREEERAQIARKIHDSLGQTLTGLRMSLSWLENKLAKSNEDSILRPIIREEVAVTSKSIDTLIVTVQDICSELRPVVLDDFGLITAAEWQGKRFEKLSGIKFNFTSNLDDKFPFGVLSTTLFRILQEALNNVARHANATKVDVSLNKYHGNIVLSIKDNGKGIRDYEAANSVTFGLLSIRERVKSFAGEVKIEGVTGNGTRLTIMIPLDKQ